ncbi:hypothetical protein EC973_000200 [Apophysomyces ossiformis]|uniref:Pentacotripeptide-repeat region of PRORP domain-containing protein n=1 Tax=Apophysomyces ossiformis TaxID=679940 RepID=A0A8H7ESZ0_9FUNG|nr:hypothetical protein EC973_000200 [Apophysomyces ossiformis]
MQRLTRVWNNRVFSLPQHTSFYSRPAPFCYHLSLYSTKHATDTVEVTHGREEQQQKILTWSEYEAMKSASHQFTREDFSALRSNLWKTKQWGTEEKVSQVLEDMRHMGHHWTILEFNEYFMVKLFQARYDDILNTYNHEFKRANIKMSNGSFNVILATYIQLGRTEEAIQLIQDAGHMDLIPTVLSFERTMHRCMPRNTALVETAKHLITEHALMSVDALNANLTQLLNKQRIADAKAMYQHYRAKGGKLEASTCGVLLKAFVDNRRIQDATAIYSDFRATGLKPNPFICLNMLILYTHKRDVNAAEQVIRDTQSGGYKLDVPNYNQLIKLYFKARSPLKAFKVFEEVQRDPQLRVSSILLNTMLDGLVINREMAAASGLYRQMLRSGSVIDTVTFNTMLKGFVRMGDYGSAVAIMSDMRKFKCEPDTVTFTTIVDAIFTTKQPSSAEEMVRILHDVGMDPNIYTFNAVINRWVKERKPEEAERTVRILRSPKYKLKPTIHTYTNLLQGFVTERNLPKAMETFQTMLRSGVEPDRAAYNFMISCFLSHDRLDDAVTCLVRMRQANKQPTHDTWRMLLDECNRRRNWSLGSVVVREFEASGFVVTSEGMARAYATAKNHAIEKK